MATNEELEALAKQELDANGFEACLQFLRDQGVGKYRTGTIMAAVLGEPIQWGRARVHLSKTWKDVRSRDELVKDTFFSLPRNRDDEEMD